MAIRTDQYSNSLTVVDTVNANAPLNLSGQGTGGVNLTGTGQNLVTYSEQFQQSAWFKNLCTITADTDTAPNGTLTADTLTTSSVGDVYMEQTGSAKGPLCYSFYVKQGGATPSADVQLRMITVASVTTDVAIVFTFSTKTFSGSTGSTTGYGYTDVGNGWFRVYATMAAASGQTGGGFRIRAANSAGSTLLIWGAQLEVSNAPGTYVQTVASVVYGTPALTFSGLAGVGLQSDGSLYHQPAGSGAVQAQANTSTATGGNVRGANAVDWQTSRGVASQVANGSFSVIGGGQSNTSSGYGGTVAGGVGNNSSSGYAFIGSGLENNARNGFSVVTGGFRNNAAGQYGFIGTGYVNTATSNTAVTTQSATMNATTAVTLSAPNAAIKIGQLINGTYITGYPNDTYVTAISGTSLTLSQAASGSGTATLSFYTPHGAVVSGGNNQATGSYSFIGGGGDAGTAGNRNVASGDWGVVVGGIKNQATGIGSFVGGGGWGLDSTTISGSIASGNSAAICGGFNNLNSGGYGFVGGGAFNTVNSNAGTISGGRFGITRSIVGYTVFPACYSPITSVAGASQGALLVLAKQTTDATASVLTSDGAVASAVNQVIMPNNSAYYFFGTIVAGVTGGGDSKGWRVEGLIKRGASAAATTLVGSTVTSSYADAGASTWTIALTADTTNGGLAVTFTGQLATTIRCVAKIETTEMTY